MNSAVPNAMLRSKPWNRGRLIVWTLFAITLLVAPMLLRSGLALTMLSQIGYLIIICLSYNMLLGQGGMLSFGHAVYTGLGSFIAIHAMNMAGKGEVPIPLGIGELVASMALMFPEFFGGEGGITTDRVYGKSFFGISFGPAIQVYY